MRFHNFNDFGPAKKANSFDSVEQAKRQAVDEKGI